MTRRNFISTTMMAAIGSSMSAPIRSSVGGFHQQYISVSQVPRSASEYIQEGLVAMWDGIENAGYGLHDDNARTIVNLCGGSPIILSDGCIVGKKTVKYTSAYANDYGGITDEMQELPLPGIGNTNEAVWRASTNNSWSVVNNGFVYRNGLCYVNHTHVAHGMGYFRNSANNFRVGIKYGVVENKMMSTTNQVMAWNNHVGYHNLVAFTMSSYDTRAFVEDSRMRILMSTSAGEEMEIGCLRIYDRSLSDEEIVYNFTIDQERFGV